MRSLEFPDLLEEKRKGLDFPGSEDGYEDLETDEKKAFDSLYLPKPAGEKYSDEEIRSGITHTVAHGIEQANLPPEERKRAEALLTEIGESLQGLSQKEMITLYAKFRKELIVILSVDSAKDEKPGKDKEIQDSREDEGERGKVDFFLTRARELARMIRREEEQKRQAQQIALKKVRSQDQGEKEDSMQQAGEMLEEDWPE